MRRAPIVAMLATVAAPALAQTPDAGEIVDRAVAAFQRVTTLRADFVQTIRDPMLGNSGPTRGEFLQQRPDKVAMRWREPAGDVLVVDGRYLWVYLPSSTPGQVVRAEVRGRPGEGPDVVAEFLERPRERFAITYVKQESVGTRAADVLQLVPNGQNLPYRRVQLWVDRQDNLPRQIEIWEASGAVRRLTFDRMRVNPRLPASTFVFTPPRGVRVVDATR